jgi:hypothetical protein
MASTPATVEPDERVIPLLTFRERLEAGRLAGLAETPDSRRRRAEKYKDLTYNELRSLERDIAATFGEYTEELRLIEDAKVRRLALSKACRIATESNRIANGGKKTDEPKVRPVASESTSEEAALVRAADAKNEAAKPLRESA